MRSRLVIIVVLVVAVTAVVFAINRLTSSASPPGRGSGKGTDLAFPSGFLPGCVREGTTRHVSAGGGLRTALAGKQPNQSGYYSGWNEPFKTSFAQTVRDHGAATLGCSGIPDRDLGRADRIGPLRRLPPARSPPVSVPSAGRSSSASGTR